MKKYPLARPYITKRAKELVNEVLDSGIISIGEKLVTFEKMFAEKIESTYACAVSSGTAGLHISMIAAGVKAGDEVITSPFSFVASANCILYMDAVPVFADIDPISYNIDPKKIEEKITSKTKAILVVHIFGQSADMEAIMAIANKHNLVVVEDACESIGARNRNIPVGTFGQTSVFAFYPNKQMTTGEGGMITTNDKDVYELCCSLRNQGRSTNLQWLQSVRLGYNYRMNEMSAALGISQLEILGDMLVKRQEIAKWYSDAFASYSEYLQIPEIASNNNHTWFVYVVLLQRHGEKRDLIMNDLGSQGISTKPYLPSIHLFDYYQKEFGCSPGDFPVSEDVSNRAVALPFYIGLTKDDISSIVRGVITVLKSYDAGI